MEVGAELESGLGVEVHSWPWGNCWGLRSEGILLPTPSSPRKITHLEWVSRSVDHQQSSRAKEARGIPDPLWPMESRELGEKKASVALLSKGVFALRFVPGGESPFQSAALRTSF